MKSQRRVEKQQQQTTFAPTTRAFRGMERERMLAGTPFKREREFDIKNHIPERFWRNLDGQVSAASGPAPQSPAAPKTYSSTQPQNSSAFVAQHISTKESQPTISLPNINRPTVVPDAVLTADERMIRIYWEFVRLRHKCQCPVCRVPWLY